MGMNKTHSMKNEPEGQEGGLGTFSAYGQKNVEDSLHTPTTLTMKYQNWRQLARKMDPGSSSNFRF